VALNISASFETLDRLVTDEHPRVREALVTNPRLPRDLLARLACDDAELVRARVAERVKAEGDAELADVLARRGQPELRALAARAPSLTPARLAELAGDVDEHVRVAVAVHQSLDPSLAMSLAEDPVPAVRAAVATRSDLTAPDLRRMSRDSSPVVVAAAAGNRLCPRGVLWRLSIGFRVPAVVARAVAASPAAGAPLLHRLSQSRRWDVRRAVALNPGTSARTLKRLGRDGVCAVREAIARAPRTPPDVVAFYAVHEYVRVKFAVASRADAPTSVIDKLLQSWNEEVRGQAARHPAASTSALAALAERMEQPAWVLRNIASNPACPPSLAEELLTWLALGGASGNPNFDPVTCVTHPGDPVVNAWQWYRNKAAEHSEAHLHPLWRVRQSVTSSRPQIPYVMLHELARDPRADVRRTTARFDGMNKAILRELCDDEDTGTVQQATAALARRDAKDRATFGRFQLKSPQRRRQMFLAAFLAALAVAGATGVFDTTKSTTTKPLPFDSVPFDPLTVPSTFTPTVTGPPPPLTNEIASAELPDGGRIVVGSLPEGSQSPTGVVISDDSGSVLVVAVAVATPDAMIQLITAAPVDVTPAQPYFQYLPAPALVPDALRLDVTVRSRGQSPVTVTVPL